MVEATVADKLGWIFREQFRADLGIDAQVEIVQDGKGTGRLLALQIKCGLSWFREDVADGWLYRGEQKHLTYWIGHSLPVIVCLCNPKTEEVFWVQITEANIARTSVGWVVKVPKSQLLNASAADTLVRVAGSPQHADIVELLIPQYLQERYSRSIYIHPTLETPHDFHGLAYMATLSEHIVFVDFIYTPMEVLDTEAVSRRVEWRAYNEHTARMGNARLHILVVGDSARAVGIDGKVAAYIRSMRDVEVTCLIYSPIPPFELHEIDKEGRVVGYGPGGERIV